MIEDIATGGEEPEDEVERLALELARVNYQAEQARQLAAEKIAERDAALAEIARIDAVERAEKTAEERRLAEEQRQRQLQAIAGGLHRGARS